ncbi:ORF_40 [Adoxophyes orana granulovirus]|uniref:ORF_40 n=1 Tax=Adoxophyes orana granulovirus TaxID=170617 RepID=Q7T9X5_GVAO|nr:ORF_40 [Adoxophyes orana granulovirus]AAP85677.1 ORF_40 [Adoxophyes orana granulovirus]
MYIVETLQVLSFETLIVNDNIDRVPLRLKQILRKRYDDALPEKWNWRQINYPVPIEYYCFLMLNRDSYCLELAHFPRTTTLIKLLYHRNDNKNYCINCKTPNNFSTMWLDYQDTWYCVLTNKDWWCCVCRLQPLFVLY